MNEIETLIKSSNIPNIDQIVINNDDDANKVSFVLKGIKKLQESVKNAYNPVIEKAHSAHKEAIAQRDKYLTPLVECEKKLKNIISVYEHKKEQEKLLLQKRAESTDEFDIELLEDIPLVPINKIDGISKVEMWKVKITDETLVPREYLIVDIQKLNALARATKGTLEIPGVEFYKENQIRVR